MPSKDTVGRIAKRSYWREADAQVVVDGWRRSGESLAAFSRRYGLDVRRVGRWAKRLSAAPVRFHPVELVSRRRDVAVSGVEIELADGTSLRIPAGFDLEDLRRVLVALDERLRC